MKTKDYCQICDQEKVDGITIFSVFICTECEKEIVQTNPDEEKYQYYIEKLKPMEQKYINSL